MLARLGAVFAGEASLVTSPQATRLRLVQSLARSAKRRHEHAQCVVEGHRLVVDALRRGVALRFALATEHALARSEMGEQVCDALRQFAPPRSVFVVEDRVMRGLSDTVSPQGMVAVFQLPTLPARQHTLAVVLDGVSDPGNVGTTLRAAEGAGCGLALLLGPECCDVFNPKAVRASAGAVFGVHTRRVQTLTHALNELAGEGIPQARVRVAVAGHGADQHTAVDWRLPSALVLGSEARGVGADVQAALAQGQLCGVSVRMQGALESLNVSSSAAVILFEAARQRAL